MDVDRRDAALAVGASAALWLAWVVAHTRLAAPFPLLHPLAEPGSWRGALVAQLVVVAWTARRLVRDVVVAAWRGGPGPTAPVAAGPLPRAPLGTAAGRTALVAALLAVAAACAVTEGGPWTAAPRMAVAATVVLLLPGLLALAAFDPYPEARDPVEHGVLALGVSYVVVTLITVAVTLLRLPLGAAALLLGAVCLGLAPLARGRPVFAAAEPAAARGSRRAVQVVLAAAALGLTTFAWRVEPLVIGEEVVELIGVRKFLEAPAITLTGTMHRPDAIPTYIFTPYYTLVALLTKLSGLPLFGAYAKLRAVWVLAALACLHALARRLSGSGAAARAVLLATALLLLLDPDPWSWPASVLPLHRRGAFAAGVLVPALLLAASHVARPGATRPAAVVLPAALLLSLVMTHALDAVLAMFFVGGLLLSALALGDGPARRRAALVLVATLGALVAYKLVHGRLVTHIAAYHVHTRRPGLGDALALLRSPLHALFGGPPEGGRYLLADCGAVTPFLVLGPLVLPALLVAARSAAVPLAAATLPALVLYSTPLGYALLIASTTNELCFAASYFGLLGLLAWLLAAYVVARSLARACAGRRAPRRDLAIASIACGVALLGASWAALAVVVRWPGALVLVAGAGAAWALRRGRPDAPLPADDRRAVACALLLLVLPTFVGLKRFPGRIEGSTRQSLPEQWRAHAAPSALRWEEYYPHLAAHTRPPIDLSRPVVDELRRLLVPRQVVLYDPAHSYTIPLLLDQYIVNPGFRLSTDYPYFDDFVRTGPDGVERHPVFDGDHAGLSDLERRFLDAYPVRYIVASPRLAARLSRKLDPEPARFRRLLERDGFIVWEVAGRG